MFYMSHFNHFDFELPFESFITIIDFDKTFASSSMLALIAQRIEAS